MSFPLDMKNHVQGISPFGGPVDGIEVGTEANENVGLQAEKDDVNFADFKKASLGDTIISGAIALMYGLDALLQFMSQSLFSDMQKKQEVARDAKNMENRVDETIAEVSKQDKADARAPLPDDVINYMKKNHIKVDNMDIDSYLRKYGKQDDKGHFEIDKGRLNAVKSALDSVSSTASDFSQNQTIRLQKITQSYQVVVQSINTMQTLLRDLTQAIIQNMK